MRKSPGGVERTARVPVVVPVLCSPSVDPKIGLLLNPGVGETGRMLDSGAGETGDLQPGLAPREYGVL